MIDLKSVINPSRMGFEPEKKERHQEWALAFKVFWIKFLKNANLDQLFIIKQVNQCAFDISVYIALEQAIKIVVINAQLTSNTRPRASQWSVDRAYN